MESPVEKLLRSTRSKKLSFIIFLILIASIVWAACSADLTRVDQPGLSSVWLTPNRLTVSRPAFGSARLRTRHTPLCGSRWAPPTSEILCGVLVDLTRVGQPGLSSVGSRQTASQPSHPVFLSSFLKSIQPPKS